MRWVVVILDDVDAHRSGLGAAEVDTDRPCSTDAFAAFAGSYPMVTGPLAAVPKEATA